MFSCPYELDAYDLAGVHLCYHFVFIFILSWCRVTLMGAIGRHITILDFKRFAANIIFLDTKAT